VKLCKFSSLFFSIFILAVVETNPAQNELGIDPEALIERILYVEAHKRSEINDVILDAEYIEGKRENDGSLKEEKRFIKKIYMRYLTDTTLYQENWLEYYKDGKLQKPENCDKEATKQTEKKRKRSFFNISYLMLYPFYPENRDNYEITYVGVAEEKIDRYVCHHFQVKAKEERRNGINGDYYFEAESFNLVRVDFSPTKLPKGIMFKLNRLNMSILYGPTPEGYWLPRQLDIEGKGKKAFFVGIRFASTEYYTNPKVNTGIQAEVFEVNDD